MLKTPFSIILLLITYGSFAQHIQKNRLDTLLRKAEQTHSEALIVYQDGRLVTEKYFAAGNASKKIEAMSCTKSIAGLAVACMLTDGLIDSLDIPVSTFYPEWKQGSKQFITLRHLVNMTSGIQNVPNTGVEIYPSKDFVQLALAAELSAKPGDVWSYNNKSLNLMAGVIAKITGKRMDQYIGERLFKPLGITDFTWSLDSAGNPHVMSGCQIKAIDFVKLGLLTLNNGQYKGRQIIAPERIREMLTPCVQMPAYGMLWWIDYSNTTLIIDDKQLETFRNAGVDPGFISKAEQLKGRFDTKEYQAKIISVLGADAQAVINEALAAKGLRLARREYSGIKTYQANGYLGNYIVVDPGTKIVAVRMISYDSYEVDEDGFGDFKDMVLSLTDHQATPYVK
ncbi:serine hydrolase domain-containing protein [Chitinophaga deserti]|uniref:serine hydrolase domain-containing protein n=1 Tax=Chitinophaga deserti TaxID=2164099 RepID=UPI0013006B6C|nr:serine hydrolase domain-containing protein [Chitinophaga deserti]